jgi:hypothetical protein
VSLIGTGVAVGLAELYSEVVGAEDAHAHARAPGEPRRDDRRLGRGVLRRQLPAVFFIAASAGPPSRSTPAFTVAKWTGLGLIGFYGFAAARLAGAARAHLPDTGRRGGADRRDPDRAEGLLH